MRAMHPTGDIFENREEFQFANHNCASDPASVFESDDLLLTSQSNQAEAR